MRRMASFFIAPFLLLLLQAPLSSAQSQESAPVASAPVSGETATPPTAGATPLEGESCVVEHQAIRVVVQNDGNFVQTSEARIKVANEACVKTFAVVSFTYASSNQVVDVDYVRVRKPDGTVVTTPDYNIQEMPAEITRSAPMYSDIREKHITVKSLSAGDTLEYQTHTHSLHPEVEGQFWYEMALPHDQIVREATLEVSFPANQSVTVKSSSCLPVMSERDGRKVYAWKYANLRREEEKSSANPKRLAPPPAIQITTFANWQEIGNWYAELQRGRVVVTPVLQKKVQELTAGLTTDEGKIRALYNYVSLKVHYVGLDFGIGRYQPHAAEDVLENGYGDCKDKHTLLAALLKAAGYDASAALISNAREFDPEVPSPSQFNHVITVVNHGDVALWMDTTPEVAPMGLLLPALRGRQALMVPLNAVSKIVRTAEDAPFPQKQQFDAQAKLAASGVLTGRIVQRYRGDGEVVFRALFRQLPPAKWKEGIQSLSYALGFGGEISNLQVKGVEQLEEPLEFSYDYTRKDYSDWDNKRILALLPPFGVESYGNNQAKLVLPLFLGSKGELEYQSRIELPAGSSISPRASLNRVESFAEYNSRSSVIDGVLVVKRKLKILHEEVGPGEESSLRSLAKAMNDDTYTYFQLEHVPAVAPQNDAADGSASANPAELLRQAESAFQQRDGMRARQLLERVLKIDNRYPRAHLNMGIVYLLESNAKSALDEFLKEEEFNPQERQSYGLAAEAARLLQDEDAQIEQSRRLLRVDPQNQRVAVYLGQTLLQRHSYSEAKEVLEKALAEAPGNVEMQSLLGEVYAADGNPEKALQHLVAAADSVEKIQPYDWTLVNNVAWTLADTKLDLPRARRMIGAALHVLEERAAQPGQDRAERLQMTRDFATLWDTTGWADFRSGNLSRAESYVRAAWLADQDSVVGDHLVDIYEAQGRKKEAAHLCELIYAGTQNKNTQSTIAAKYRKLTGKVLSNSNPKVVNRLPNGTWPVTPLEELMQIRTVTLAGKHGPSASASLDIVFSAGKSPEVIFRSGDERFKTLIPLIEKAKFQVLIPEDSHGILYREAIAMCSQYTACTIALTPLSGQAVFQGGVQE